MFANLLPRLVLLAASSSLVGCHLYVESGSEGEGDDVQYCRGDFCTPESQSVWPDAGSWSDGGGFDDPELGQTCTASYQCGPGCYCNPDGFCEEIPPEPDAAPFSCADLSGDEDACAGHEDCAPVYRGIDCTAEDGSECATSSVNCTCESFQYDHCEDAQP